MNHNALEIFSQISILKDVDYKNTLAISVLIELLIEKNIFTRQDFAQKASALENSTLAEIAFLRRISR